MSNVCKRVYSKFKDNVYTCSFRHDGRLLLAAGERPVVTLLDVSTKAILRTLKGHTAAIHTCTYTHEHTSVLSTSDDKSIRMWDITSGEQIRRCRKTSKLAALVWYLLFARYSMLLS
jgi:U3 small nucleolar RNA-associated protein 15